MKVQLPVRKAILLRRTYEAPAEGRAGKIRLDFNENTTGCGPAALRCARAQRQAIATYPEYAAPTRKLARYFRVHPEELLLTNGGDDALRVFFDTFVEPRSHVLICEPTFPMYRYYAEIAGARVQVVRYGPNMEFPLADALAALRKKPRVFFLANPNNPTGTLVGKAAIRKLLRAATHTVVVMDEAYAEFSGLSVVPWIRKYPQLFVARTFSKAEGLAGLRLGAVLGRRDSLALGPARLASLPGQHRGARRQRCRSGRRQIHRAVCSRRQASARVACARTSETQCPCLSQRRQFPYRRFWQDGPRLLPEARAPRHFGP